MRFIAVVLIAVLMVTTGCSSYHVKVNGSQLNDAELYADSGQTATDTAPEPAKKRWYETTLGKMGILVGVGILILGIRGLM